ncbi:MAG: hypothetical protein ACTHXF_11720, partial [Brevibacterium yomogidense]
QVSEAQDAAEAAAAAATAAEARATEANNRAMTRLANGNFEDGLKYWKPLSSIVLTEDSHSGEQAAHLTNTTARLEPDSALPVVAGQIWELSLFYKSSIDDPEASMTASLRDTAGAVVGAYADLSPTGGEWAASGPVRVTIPDGIDMVTTHILPRNVSGTGCVVDDITLRDVTDVVRLEDAANGARQRADEAISRADALDGLVGTLRTDLDAASGRIDTVQDVTLPALAGDLSGLDTSMSDLEGVVGPLPGAVAAAQEDATRALADAAGKASVVAQPSAPTPDGDTLWIDTSDGNKPKVWADLGPGPRENLVHNPQPNTLDGYRGMDERLVPSPWDASRTAVLAVANGEHQPYIHSGSSFGTLPEGTVVTLAGKALFPDDRLLQVRLRDASGYVGTHTNFSVGYNGEFAVTATLPEDVLNLRMSVMAGNGSGVAGDEYVLGDVAIYVADNAGPYFDGDSPGARWSGEPHASTSIYDGPAWVEVQDAGVREALAGVDALEGTVGTLQTDLDEAEAAVATVRDVTLPALDGRLDTAEYDVKHISGEWITAGTVDTNRLNANSIAAAVATVIELNADRITAGLIQGDQINANSIAAAVASVIELNAGSITTGQLGADRIAVNELAVQIADVIQLNADRITSGTISTGRLNASEIAAAVASVIQLNANRITSGTIDTDRLNATTIAAAVASIIQLNASRITSGTIDTDRLNAEEIGAAVGSFIELDAEQITGGKITGGQINAESVGAAVGTFIELNASQITAGTIDTNRLAASEIWANIAVLGKIITEDLIATGAVTAEALNVVYTDPDTGYGIQIVPEGITLLDQDGIPTVTLRADGSVAIAVLDSAGAVVGGIDQEGNVTGKTVAANEGLEYRGTELADLLNQFPRGVMAHSHNVAGATIGTNNSRLLQVSFVTPTSNRHIKITIRTNAGTSAPRMYYYMVQSTGTSTTPNNSRVWSSWYTPATTRGGALTHEASWVRQSVGSMGWPLGETITLGVYCRSLDSGNSGTFTASNDQEIYVEDMGPAINMSAHTPWVPSGGGGTGGGSETRPETRVYTQTFNSTWVQSFWKGPGGGRYPYNPQAQTRGYTGYWSAANGVLSSMWGFSRSAIMSFCSGAEMVSAQLRLKNDHSANNGTTTIELWNARADSRPTTESGRARIGSPSFSPGQTRWLGVDSAMPELKSGATSAFRINPPSWRASTAGYGYFNGTAVLEIKVKK